MNENLAPKKDPPRRVLRAPPSGRASGGMREIAALAGVSAMTVSRALKGEANVDPDTRERILAAAERIGYVVNLNARVFASGKSGFVAVIGGPLEEDRAAESFRIWSETLGAAGLQLLHGGFARDSGEEQRIVEALLQRRPEAFILPGGAHTPVTAQRLREAGAPVIETGYAPLAPLESFVGLSLDAAFGAAAKRAQGGREAPRLALGRDPSGAFAAAARRAGVRLWKPASAARDDIERGAAAADSLAAAGGGDLAIVCETVALAFGLASGLSRRPGATAQAIAVCGLGDNALARHGPANLVCLPIALAPILREAASLAIQAVDAARRGQRREPVGRLIDIAV